MADLLLSHSMTELDYLDGWARLTWMQYGSISQSLWLNGEMAASIEDSMSAARGSKAGVALVAGGEGAAEAPVGGADPDDDEEAEEDIISLESESRWTPPFARSKARHGQPARTCMRPTTCSDIKRPHSSR